jgi:opacity protein-like surface antigen
MENIMRLKFLLSLVLAAVCAAPAVYAQHHAGQDTDHFHEELNERDWDALRDFVNTKRTIDVQEKGTNLAISGDVRTEWRHLTEKEDGENLRGGYAFKKQGDEKVRLSRNDFDIEANLRFDYVLERSWAVVQLEFDNSAGVDSNDFDCGKDPNGWKGSGRCDDICLQKAYFGYNLCSCEDTRLDVEIGRRNLYNAFDSKIQFLSRFDGILFRYTSKWNCVGDWYWNLAGFLVDERSNHFAWATEFGLLNIMDYGVDLKYSFIDWQKHGENRCFIRNPKGFNFLVSQFTMYYHINPDILCRPARIYGAFLINHAQRNLRVVPGSPELVVDNNIEKSSSSSSSTSGDTGNHGPHGRANPVTASTIISSASGIDTKGVRANLGWYLGFTIGDVDKEGDWAFDARWEYVQAAAIGDEDASGITRGNVLHNSFTKNHRGNTNYKGYIFEGLYAVTDNLTLDAIIEFSRACRKSIGGSHKYSKFELEAIYAF